MRQRSISDPASVTLFVMQCAEKDVHQIFLYEISICPIFPGKSVKAADALEKFASNRYVTVRRCLETP
jgi:hypothetical protein